MYGPSAAEVEAVLCDFDCAVLPKSYPFSGMMATCTEYYNSNVGLLLFASWTAVTALNSNVTDVFCAAHIRCIETLLAIA